MRRRTRLLGRVLGWLVGLVMVPVVAREHRPRVALGWLALIFAVPWVGPVLYFLFGELSLRRSVRRHARIRERLEGSDLLREQAPWAIRRPEEEPDGGPPGRDLVPDDFVRLVDRMTDRVDDLPVLSGNHVEVFRDTAPAIDALVADIESARHHVHLLFFIFNPDAVGRRVAAALERAAGRGVACRVLADAFGSGRVAEPSFFTALAPDLRRAGVEVHESLPVRLLRRPLARLDVRNHRKLAVIDGRSAFAGSLNVHAEDFALETGRWRQMTLRLEGPAVHQLQTLFAEDWYFATEQTLDRGCFPAPERAGSVWVQAVPGGPTYESDFMEQMVIAALNRARERVILTSPYFVPTDAVLIALRLAALRGVRVQVIVPVASDRRAADLAGRAYFAELLAAGVEIHLHDAGLLHAKSLSVDDRFAMVGSANLDRRSFYLNYEVNLVLYGDGAAADVCACQHVYLEEARRVDAERWRHRGRSERLWEESAKLLSPVL